jgi:putative MATE family efflux protein
MQLKVQTSHKAIFGIALPIALSMLVPQINFITNNIFLGTLGTQELASAGITGVYYLIFAVVGNGLNNGLQSLIARRAGQELPKEIGKLFYHGIWIALAISLVGITITYFIAPYILRSVLHNTAIADQAISFIFIRIWGLPFLYLYVMRNALLVGTNQTKLLVWGTLIEALVNILLDYLLIYGHYGFPKLGFNGAAYASIIAEASGLLVIYIVIRINGLHKSFAFFDEVKWDGKVAKLILVQSSPLIAQYAISILSWEYFYILIEHHGEQALAISNTMRNIFGVFGIFAWSFAATSNSMVSNLIGQQRIAEVIPLIKRIATISFSISFVTFIILNVAPEVFLQIYSQSDEFIKAAVPVMRIISVALLLMSVGTVWLNSVTGTGNTVINLMIEGITIVMYCTYVYVILEYYNLPITWGWASEWVYWLSMFSMSFFYMRSGKWKGKKI